MWLEDRRGVELRNHTTGGVSVDKLFLGNVSVSNTNSKIIIYALALYNSTETGYHLPLLGRALFRRRSLHGQSNGP